MRSRAASIVLVVFVIGLGLLVLWPTHPDALWRPFTLDLLAHFAANSATAWISYGVLNDAANLVLFLPTGLIAILAFGAARWWLIFLVGAACASAAEVAQALFLPGRTPDVTDAVFGAVGVLIGVGIGCGILALWTRARRRPRTDSPSDGA